MRDSSHICDLHHNHGNARSWTHWAKPWIEPTSLWILVGFKTHWATIGTPCFSPLKSSVGHLSTCSWEGVTCPSPPRGENCLQRSELGVINHCYWQQKEEEKTHLQRRRGFCPDLSMSHQTGAGRKKKKSTQIPTREISGVTSSFWKNRPSCLLRRKINTSIHKEVEDRSSDDSLTLLSSSLRPSNQIHPPARSCY